MMTEKYTLCVVMNNYVGSMSEISQINWTCLLMKIWKIMTYHKRVLIQL